MRFSLHTIDSNTSEFARKSRSLDEALWFNTTDVRQFLLYTGVVLFKEFLTYNASCQNYLIEFDVRLLIHRMESPEKEKSDRAIEQISPSSSNYPALPYMTGFQKSSIIHQWWRWISHQPGKEYLHKWCEGGLSMVTTGKTKINQDRAKERLSENGEK